MPDLFETDDETVHVTCSECGAPLELASSALSLFGSSEAVVCMDCLLRQASNGTLDATVPLHERIRLIEETVDEFAAHLRNVLVRCIKPDLTWNREYGLEGWSDPTDMIAAAYAPGIWYTVRQQVSNRAARHDDN